MRHQYLCIAAILSVAALGGTAALPAQAGSIVLAGKTESSPVYTMSFSRYRWKLPEFRMAGKNAFVVVRIQNTHDYEIEVSMRCKARGKPIPQMTGTKTVKPHEFMYVDTRKLHDPMQRGDGVRVNCRFRANGSAKVEAWFYDEEMRVARRNVAL